MKNATTFDFGSLNIQSFYNATSKVATAVIRWDGAIMDRLSYLAESSDDAVDQAVRFATENAQLQIIG
jgi:hypothetical protein